MYRADYALFQEGRIAEASVKNRLVRSATHDRAISSENRVSDGAVTLYENLARGGVGLIITGLYRVMSRPDDEGDRFVYSRVPEYQRIARAVHGVGNGCRVFVQLMGDTLSGPSSVMSPRWGKEVRALSVSGIENLIDCFVSAISDVREMGFDGAQLHGAFLHNCLSYFLSPYCNHRTDEFGGSATNRARIVSEIISAAREKVGKFPIITKVNSTDNLEGGMNIDAFPEMASALEEAGVDAIEISGTPYDRRGRDLNASPHFEEHAGRVDVQCPLVLTGGLRDVEQCEKLVRDGVSFVGLCRPLLCQPDLPSRWLSNREDTGSECISCNSCQYSVRAMKKDHAVCLYKEDTEGFRQAQEHFASDKSV